MKIRTAIYAALLATLILSPVQANADRGISNGIKCTTGLLTRLSNVIKRYKLDKAEEIAKRKKVVEVLDQAIQGKKLTPAANKEFLKLEDDLHLLYQNLRQAERTLSKYGQFPVEP